MSLTLRGFFTALLILTFFGSCNQKGGKLKYGQGELLFSENVDRQAASKLGEYLSDKGFFDEEKKKVRLDLKNGNWQFFIPVNKGMESDDQFNYLARFFGLQLSKEVFNNQPVDVHLCNTKLESLRVVRFACNPSEMDSTNPK